MPKIERHQPREVRRGWLAPTIRRSKASFLLSRTIHVYTNSSITTDRLRLPQRGARLRALQAATGRRQEAGYARSEIDGVGERRRSGGHRNRGGDRATSRERARETRLGERILIKINPKLHQTGAIEPIYLNLVRPQFFFLVFKIIN